MADKVILFDLDGTLWDSYPWYSAVAAELTGGSADELHARLRNGESIVTMLLRESLERNQIRRHCVDHVENLQLFPGVSETLTELTNTATMGVVTSLPKWLAEPLLSELDLAQFFEATEFAARKPSPTAILAAMKRLGAERGEPVYYIGDMPNDALAAHRAGAQFGWAAYGYGNEQPSNCAIVINAFPDVLGV